MGHFSRILTAAATTITALAFAQGAHAADLCVGASAACSGKAYPFTQSGLSTAVSDAGATPEGDRIILAAGTINANSAGVYVNTNYPIEIMGAGTGATTLSMSGLMGMQVALGINAPGSSLHDLSVDLTSVGGSGTGVLSAYGTQISKVHVRDLSGNAISGVTLGNGGSLSASSVTLKSSTSQAIGSATDSNITDVAVDAGGGAGVVLYGGTHNVDRVRVSNASKGVQLGSGFTNITNSLVELGTRKGAIGVVVDPPTKQTGNVEANMVFDTIVGAGPGQHGVQVTGGAGPAFAKAQLARSVVQILAAGAADLDCEQPGGGSAQLSTGVAAFHTVATSGSCIQDNFAQIDTALQRPGFVNAAAGNYRLRWDSPLVDGSGFTGTPGALDAAGSTRAVDGDGDGNVVEDIGAYEYQRSAPLVSLGGVPSQVALGTSADLSASATDADGEAVTFAWSFSDGGPAATGATTSHLFQTPGAQAVTVVATDEAGQSSSITAPVSVMAPASQGAGAGGNQTAPPAPQVTVSKKPTRGYVSGHFALELNGKNKGWIVGLTVANATSLEVTIARTTIGHLKKGSAVCRSGAGKGKSRCVRRTAIAGKTTLPTKGGAVALGFGGTVAPHPIRKGNYEMTITPVSGTTRGKPVVVPFRVK